MRYKVQHPKEFDRIIEAIDEVEHTDEVYLFKKKDVPLNQGSLSLANLHLIEGMAAKITKVLDKPVHSVDLVFLIWLRDYEYVSRGYAVQQMEFLTIAGSYRFFQRNLAHSFLKEVRTRTVGLRNGSSFYLSKKGYDLAAKVATVLENNDLKAVRRV